ncbi:MAG: hypothetical protein CMP91_06650 [Gammaproteobacteria bacterium]|nr:hypothetical protein [Gammaproteobacteria bacterium]MAY02537.1 hypothetical protein [Gammaproteobacteria bacterium]|tara:strand:- start:484 stop:1299 length:816 start_codon:yes stop_codon:yes gene_type:complete
MPEKVDPLILKFATERPDELAGILAGANPGELAQLFTDLPADKAAMLATRLPSWQLSSLLNKLSSENGRDLLIAASTSDGIAIVSHLPESRYPAILSVCNEEEKAKLRKLFDFPSHSLASLALPQFISAEASLSCEDFSRQLSQNDDTRPQPIFVVDEQGKYLGRLSLQAVFSVKNRKKQLLDVMTRVEALSGMTSADTALGSRLWTQHLELAVVDNRHRLLGVVNRSLLQQVAGNKAAGEFSTERLFSELATDYLNACGHLLESVLGKRP